MKAVETICYYLIGATLLLSVFGPILLMGVLL